MSTKNNKSVRFIRWACGVIVVLSWMSFSAAAASYLVSEPEGTPAAASAEASAGAATEVKIDNFAFTPGVVTVKAGTQVTWINHDDIPHTVDSTQGKFKSAAMDTDDKFQFRFTEPGEYPFYCRMHPKMTGKIIVQP